MPPRHQLHVSESGAAAYRSTACRVGTHAACTEASPSVAPVDLPVIYETCACPCHIAPDNSTRPAVKR
ncbi:hypothetical protein F0345_17260 [Streptomyces rutgersensis]|uniref:Uncharacterized protein n=1 Tax=Streptomyces rutgersensis TaxID=53451 RepID=A0ABX6RPM5_9ACTN|nr:hypothetical protein ADL32_02940 [Streptomyces albidoflavus]QNE82648.1 hypothetical protein F0345_17260 [Streptomyces rutgersensis]